MPSGAERRTLYPAAAGVILAADLASKALAERLLDTHTVVPVLGDWLRFHLAYNPGAGFGLDLGAQSRWIFLVTALLAIVVLTRIALGTAPLDRFRLLALGLVAGGAAGNLIDRIRSAPGVVDFFDLGIGAARFPTFNVADIGVTTGAVLLAVSYWLADARARAEA
jgi:signal peptidase II